MFEIKSKLKFLKDNKQVFYSIAVILIIPGIIILNTWLFSQSFIDTVDRSIQDKAMGIGQAINVGLTDKLASAEDMQKFVDDWKNYNSDAASLNIYSYDGNDFRLIAGFNKSQIGSTNNSPIYALAWNGNESYAFKSTEKVDNNVNTSWNLVMPLKDSSGKKQVLLSMNLSADVVNTILAIALSRSFLILIAGIVFILLLLWGNSRLFEYSILYNKIKEVDQMKDEFISMASHELRTPITVINGYISLIQEEQSKLNLSGDIKEYLGIISVSTERLGTLVEDLLNVSRIEQGRLKMTIEQMDVWPIIEEIVKELKVQSDSKGLVLSSVLEPNAISLVKIDKDRFKQVLINIIGNSIKYTPKGSVTVTVRNKANSLLIVVKDTGIGMSAKDREHLFEKFYRVKKKETEEIIGTGLGLWITKQIVELMQGTISVDSMEGVGTQVTIELPLTK